MGADQSGSSEIQGNAFCPNRAIRKELRKFFENCCTGSEFDELCGLLLKLELTENEDIQNITNTSVGEIHPNIQRQREAIHRTIGIKFVGNRGYIDQGLAV